MDHIENIIALLMNNLIRLSLILLLTAISCKPQKYISQSNTIKPAENENAKRVFLFAGQSNMDGRANADHISEADLERLEKVAGRIQFYYNRRPVTPLQVSEPAGSWLKKKFSLNKYFGPELFFGIELAEAYPNEEFIFIKRAKGGTSLYGCWNPEWTEEKAALMDELDQPKLYGDFVSYVDEVLEKHQQGSYRLSAMFWVQGENDSGVKKWGDIPANEYGGNLRKLIAQTRDTFNVPELPFILFQVGHGKVVEGMKQNADSDEYTFMVPQSRNPDSEDFYEKNPPPIGHYTAKSMKRIGVEFFKVFHLHSK